MTDQPDPVETLARANIEALAYRLWSLDPRDIPEPTGMPDNFQGGARAWFYANQIAALVAEAVAQEREACAKLCSEEADRCDDAARWGGARAYVKTCRDAAYAMRDRAAAIRARTP